MSACGINIRGRARKLYLNYRTTEEIRRLAISTLEGCEVDDLDEGSDEVKRYKSISHGAAPKVLNFNHFDDALEVLPSVIDAGLGESRSICVIVPTKHEVNSVYTFLKAKKIDTTILGPDERDRPESKTVRIATMHRAKGLEFDEVIVISPSQGFLTGLRSETNKRLKYVALSRAKKIATAIQY